MESETIPPEAGKEEPAQPEPATSRLDLKETEVGSVFVSNYPPFSVWQPELASRLERVLSQPSEPDVPLGLYLHIPFCRKRCKFCYFRVYTDKNSEQIQRYLETLKRELELYQRAPALQDRALRFIYFGGGTPSFLSARQLDELVHAMKEVFSWQGVSEVTFECEPGTLSEAKVEALQGLGVTRLSLGVEGFDDRVLELNGRAHVSKEIFRSLPWIKNAGFDQVNIDLISGMVGETRETWRDSIRKTIDFEPDSVTIYQMELPFNTQFSRQLAEGSLDRPLADWDTKREWHDYAFCKLSEAGYSLSSAYTMVKDPSTRFVYRDSLWHGADMIASGVSSFGHLGTVHYQNASSWDAYLDRVARNELPVSRAFATSARDRLTREMLLQLKLGHIDRSYFADKFDVDIIEMFSEAFRDLEQRQMLRIVNGSVELTRQGLLRVDTLLPTFYAPEYRNRRYT